MRVKFILIAAILVGARILHSQDLPASARHALNQRFSDWAFRPNHIPNPCDQYGSDQTSFPAVQKCNLNGDGIPDYAVVVTRGHDSASVEYFLALVSKGRNYELNVLDTVRHYEGGGEKLLAVVAAGTEVAFFSNADIITAHGRMASEDTIILPTDVIQIYPACESHWKEVEAYGYVFIDGKIVTFNAAD